MKENNDGNIPFYVALAIFIIFIVLGLTYILQGSSSYDDRGTFGDMFGGANALFTGLSVIGLLYTILLQRKDLKHQQEQLELQNKATLLQNFETTFFNLINVHHQIINSMQLIHQVTSSGIKTEIIRNARGVFLHLFGLIHKSLHNDGTNFSQVYSRVYMPLNFHLDHYYNNLLQIIKYIDESEIINQVLKNKYCMILSSQLSEHEKIMVFYHIIYINYGDEFKNLVEKYDILNNFNYDFIVPEILAQKYNPKMK
ncbi:putative phage abortive infection protein [Chryseobacterium luteum]|uniref:Phage abortive infection protein n=1 Tax=Chryseobacterium luteum TaxID=421531 RepID=A0A085YY10_9FLAO|nr:putative phage abortive infection protein [Chryseobacterium luteum]KFE97073.1 hypothetical protein IX38_21660 [Chryseobacterium luteum]